MHYRFLVTFHKEHAATSTEARAYAAQYLNDTGFVYNDTTRLSCGLADGDDIEGRWDVGLADWYVIGGRWSGELSRHSWAQAITETMDALEQEKDVQVWGVFYADKVKQRLQQAVARECQALWDATAPEAYEGIPIQRDTYKADGYEDDAMPLTQALYDALLKAYEDESADSDYHADLDGDEVTPAMIGTKWLVVVDYHA